MKRALVAAAVSVMAAACPPNVPDVVDGEGGQWELLPELGQGARQETAVLALNGEVVVLGGFTGLGAIVPLVEVYDPIAERWRTLPEMPAPLHHANAAVVDEKIVIGGFLRDGSFTPDGRVFIFDPSANAWSEGARMPDGTERGASGATAHDGFLYVFGGIAGGSSAAASRYDVENDAWEELPDLPANLDHLGAVTIGNEIFIVGGRSNGLGNHTSTLLSFNPSSREYTERASMPTSRAGFGAAVVDGELYVVGGEGNADADNGVFPQAEAYDPETNEWRAVVDMRTPRHGMGATGVDGALYVPGGADVQGFGAVSVVERFVPES